MCNYNSVVKPDNSQTRHYYIKPTANRSPCPASINATRKGDSSHTGTRPMVRKNTICGRFWISAVQITARPTARVTFASRRVGVLKRLAAGPLTSSHDRDRSARDTDGYKTTCHTLAGVRWPTPRAEDLRIIDTSPGFPRPRRFSTF